MQPLHAGPAMTSWGYKTVPEDFIVRNLTTDSIAENMTSLVFVLQFVVHIR